MSDDQWGRRPGRDEPPYGRDDDATRRPPGRPDDATRVPPGRGDDATRIQPNYPDDATRIQPTHPDDATRVQPNHPDGTTDPTQRMPRSNDPRSNPPDRTSVMPPVSANQNWAGRAEVRPPRDPAYGEGASDWSIEPPAEPRGKWWLPILIGVIALILLALLGWGIYLITQNQGDEPTPTPTAAPTLPVTTPTTEPTTAAATTAAPTTTAPSPQEVTVPALRGLSQDAAQQALSRRGLSARLKFRTTTEAPAGTVIDSDPAEGQDVPPSSVVTLIIASAPPSPSASSSSPTPPPAGG